MENTKFKFYDELKQFKSANMQLGKSELLKILHQEIKAANKIKQDDEILNASNVVLSSLNHALIDLLQKHGVDFLREISKKVLDDYIENRKKEISQVRGTITEQGVRLIGQFSGQDAVSNNARIAGESDKKAKPTKDDLLNYRTNWIKNNEFKTGSNSDWGWKKDACEHFKITRNTLTTILTKTE